MARRGKQPPPPPEVQAIVAEIMASGDPHAAFGQLMAGLLAAAGPDAGIPGTPAASGADPFWHRNPSIELPDPPATPTLITIKVSLDGARPPIWRRLELRGDLTLDRVHEVLQVAMGWDDYHLHRFEPGPVKDRGRAPYFVTDADLDEGENGTREDGVRLDQVLRAKGDRLFYTYDFGDDWAHTITAEAVRPATDDDPPARVLKMVRACPPEDVGGMYCWNELVAALRDNPDPLALTDDLEQYATWLPDDFDPAHVDLDETNALLAAMAEQPDLSQLHPWVADVLRRAPHDLAPELTALLQRATAPVALVPSPEELHELLRPWQTVLDVAGPDGIPLTKAGWMVPAACERLWHESGVAWEIGKGNREQHTPELMVMREHATAARLIRKHKDRLVRTPLGRRAAGDPHVLADALAASLMVAKGQFDRDARAVALLLVAGGFEPGTASEPAPLGVDRPIWRFESEVARILTALGWRQDDGPVQRYGISGLRTIEQVLVPQLGNARGGPAPTTPAARFLARKALTPSPA